MMQVKLIKDCSGPNPDFDRKKPISKKKIGKYEDGTARRQNWPELDKPKGMIIDHPDSHFLCYGEDPNAEPFDDEAKEKFAEYLELRTAAEAASAAEAAAAEESGDDPA